MPVKIKQNRENGIVSIEKLSIIHYCILNQTFVFYCTLLGRPCTVVTGGLIQESCAVAKMTAQCAPYMGAMKIFWTP